MRVKSKNSTTRADASQASPPGAQVDNRCQAGESWEARRVWPHSDASRASRAHDPAAPARSQVHRWFVGLLLGLVLICSGLACAPQFVGPTAAGYIFVLDIPTSIIFLGDAAELIVSVRNAQGQLVDGVPVFFQVEPTWAQSASVSPQVVSTQQGTVRALFRARTTGVVHITVRVDNASQETRITVASRPSPQASSTPGDHDKVGATPLAAQAPPAVSCPETTGRKALCPVSCTFPMCALKASREHDEKAMNGHVEVLVYRQEFAMPPTISLEHMTGGSER